jgi:hypothetical protein
MTTLPIHFATWRPVFFMLGLVGRVVPKQNAKGFYSLENKVIDRSLKTEVLKM